MNQPTYTEETRPSRVMRQMPVPRQVNTVIKLLEKIPHGQLTMRLPAAANAQQLRFGGDSGSGEASDSRSHPHLRAHVDVHDWQALVRASRSGDIGFAESYMDGQWSSPQLVDLLRLLLINRQALDDLIYGSWWGSLLYRVKHMLNRNSKAGSAKNIHAHYDLGNAFYALWLDPSMNYSSAWFAGDTSQTLEQGQRAKMRRALTQAAVTPGSRVLEVGCGWGAVAEMATAEFGAQLLGITLSQEQLHFAQQRLVRQGLAGVNAPAKAELRLQDYRDLAAEFRHQPFDAIVSIEMFEAVGRAYWPAYFAMLRDCLKPGGKACIQTITIRDDLFSRYVRGSDFIQQYIFPGGLLPSPSLFVQEAQKAGLRVCDSFSFGQDYAHTLQRWRGVFLATEPAVRAQGFDARFVRLWEFYLAYCEAAFAQANTDVIQFTLVCDNH